MSKSAQEFADEIAKTFRMRPRRHGREWRVPCPVHEAEGHHNPSLAIWDGSSRPLLKCMTGCSRERIRDALRARGVQVPGAGVMSTAEQIAAARAKEEQRLAGLMRAFEVLNAAHPVELDDPVSRYLSSRYLIAPEAPNTVYTSEDPVIAGGFAMGAPIVDLSTLQHEHARVVGVSTLSLRQDGTPVLVGGKKLRSIAGQQKGCGVPLGRLTKTIIVGEGIESVLAARAVIAPFFGVACLSASNVPFLAPPEWVEEIIVAQDNDDAGRGAAEGLRRQLEPLGVRVTIETCSARDGAQPVKGYDFADYLKDLREVKA